MSEFPRSSKHNLTPRRALALAAAGLLLMGASKGCGGTPDIGDQHGGVPEKIATIVKADPATQKPYELDCVDYFKKKDGLPQRVPEGGSPRTYVFESNKGTLWAGQVMVKYGYEILDEDGKTDTKDTAEVPYWVAEDNTGEAATTRYASGNSSLPSNATWQKQLELPTKLTEDGTRLPNIGTDPDGSGTQVVVARISPYFIDDIINGIPNAFHDPGTIAVECQEASNNEPLPSDQQRKTNITQVGVIHVPDSVTVTHTPEED